jgi:hypothetical protein
MRFLSEFNITASTCRRSVCAAASGQNLPFEVRDRAAINAGNERFVADRSSNRDRNLNGLPVDSRPHWR